MGEVTARVERSERRLCVSSAGSTAKVAGLAHFDRERIPERVVHGKGSCL
jgi:hypothetical protein